MPKGGIEIPTLPTLTRDDITQSAIEDVRSIFKNHPGDAQLLWLPVTHQAAKEWLETFLAERLEQFGRYEDAMKLKEPVLFHSALSSLMNCGLLTPRYVVEQVLQAYESGNAPLAAVEGFVRQVIGWREYMYGKYRLQRQELLSANYFGFTKQLETWWYGDEQIPASLLLPVRDALEKTIRYGYAHHIERLMILGNWFLLNQYDPKSVYEWFLSMYTDAYEWVMVGNVMGMSQYADGGGIATKPYISGGNYLQTMGRFWSSAKVARESEFTVKYWQFVESNYDKLKNNHRMSLVLKRISPKR